MDCYFRQSWVDKRLSFSGQKTLALSIEMLRKIWKPGLNFNNILRAAKIFALKWFYSSLKLAFVIILAKAAVSLR
jgi:hypothetical protein